MDSCVETTMIVPFSLFWLGALITILMIRKVNQFTVKDTVKAAIGMLGYSRTRAITAAQIFTLIIPMSLWFLMIQSCKSALGS